MPRVRFQVGTRHFVLDWYQLLYKRGDHYADGPINANVYDASLSKDSYKIIGHVTGWSLAEVKAEARKLVEKELRRMGLYGIAEDRMTIPQQPQDLWR